MDIRRKKTRQIAVGGVTIGGDAPVRVQSMTNTPTNDVELTLAQIRRLIAGGCELVRVSVPDERSADALPDIKAGINIPLIADIHFDWRMAVKAIERGADAVRINPGNIRDADIKQIVRTAKEAGVAVRIGVNAGSLRRDILKHHGHPTPAALVESALETIGLCESVGFENLKVSVKASSVPATVDAYRLLSDRTDYPLHIGVSEAGPFVGGTVKSAVGLGILLSEGIGDTIRVSLTADPAEEVRVAYEILKSLGLKQGLTIVSCPTCARCQIDMIPLVDEAEAMLAQYRDQRLTVAIMGCVVNGPGEAREADVGIAAGRGGGVLMKNGEIVKKISEDEFLDELMKAVRDIVNVGKGGSIEPRTTG